MSYRATYRDAIAWIMSGRPDSRRLELALRVFGTSFAAGIAVFGVAAYFSPSDFGQPGGDLLRLGWPTVVYVTLTAAAVGTLVALRRRIAWVAARVREPYVRRLSDQPGWEGAMNALAACPRAIQLRFALGWSWGPAGCACAGVVAAASAAYLVVYAVLARGEVGWETAALGVADVVLGLIVLAAAAQRLTTWRVATSVYRAVTPHYLV